MNKYLIYIVFIGILLSACVGKTHKKKIAKLDSLLLNINFSLEKVNKVDTHSLSIKYKDYKATMAKLSACDKNLFSDSLKQLTIKYEELENSFFSNFKKQYFKNINSLNKSKTQIENFKDDVKNNLMPKEKFDEYYNDEKKEIIVINQNVDVLLTYLKNYSDLFDNLNPKIKNIHKEFFDKKIKKISKIIKK